MAIGTGTIAAATALVAGALGITHAVQTAPEGQKSAPVVVGQKTERSAELQRLVSGNFENASLAEVCKWLSGQGVSFVADGTSLSGDAKLTANLQNQPLGDVMDAIADAFGGRWDRHGNIYTLHRGVAYWAPKGGEMREFEIAPGDMKGLEEMKILGPKMEEVQKMLEKMKGEKGFTVPDIKDFKFEMPDM